MAADKTNWLAYVLIIMQIAILAAFLHRLVLEFQKVGLHLLPSP